MKYTQCQPIVRPCPSPPVKYTLYDVGETDAPLELLSRYAVPSTYAPTLNDLGEITYNTLDQGYVRYMFKGILAPRMLYHPGYCWGINNKEDALVSIHRPRGSVDWMVWSLCQARKMSSEMIDLVDAGGMMVYLRAINDDKLAVGCLSLGDGMRPLMWNPHHGLHHVGYFLGWDIHGVAWDVNCRGTLIGALHNCEDNPPFIWSEKEGYNVLAKYRTELQTYTTDDLTRGGPHFEDMAIADDNTVYGTLWVDDCENLNDPRFYRAFQWIPARGKEQFNILDLNGMRINAVNKDHTLAGSLDGEAAVSQKYFKPKLLKNLLGVQAKDWVLMEVTDINNKGQMTGYGLYQGKMHIFFVDRPSNF